MIDFDGCVQFFLVFGWCWLYSCSCNVNGCVECVWHQKILWIVVKSSGYRARWPKLRLSSRSIRTVLLASSDGSSNKNNRRFMCNKRKTPLYTRPTTTTFSISFGDQASTHFVGSFSRQSSGDRVCVCVCVPIRWLFFITTMP